MCGLSVSEKAAASKESATYLVRGRGGGEGLGVRGRGKVGDVHAQLGKRVHLGDLPGKALELRRRRTPS